MEDPLAASKGGPVVLDTLSADDAGVTETCAPVTTKNRLLEISSVPNSCVTFESDIAVGGIVVV